MQGPTPISARLTNRIKNSVVDSAGDPVIDQNRELLLAIAAALEDRNNLFPFLQQYIDLLNQPTDPQLLMFLGVASTNTLESILNTILNDLGSGVGPGHGHGRGRGRGQGRQGRGRAARGDHGGGQPNLYSGHEIHNQTRLGFNRRIVRFQGMRDRITPKQYYCMLRNPMAFDRLLIPLQQELSVGVYLFCVEANPIPPDAIAWTLAGNHTFNFSDVVLVQDKSVPSDDNGWSKVQYSSTDVPEWIVVHYFNSNKPRIHSMEAMVDNLSERFNTFKAADAGRLAGIINSIP